MQLKVKISCVSQGFLRAVIFTIICLMAYTLIATFGKVAISDKTYGIIFMAITLVSVLLGAGYASRKAGENGWLIGMIVGFTYIVFIYVVSMVSMGKFSFSMSDLMRILLCVFAGTLSGMLGINI
ncbi:putative membrane protein, TIGR04086 family [Hathewaya proteolytica DSM 3090]|uniref:Putative membrane protein, TIGR04086 family n=1 Tax=Hathewaya proteolytica DSM 3090 TaxID=1121331 RepID=A0A1M6P8F9_9CLOT|nr:TIGR04086 family membrane protein [Hathewaya proteolytica]SHK04257.1 putative membrane protein, TIGR04086 family [Hathewaya proteolytica DSM 3090]